MKIIRCALAWVTVALCLALVPASAFAADDAVQAGTVEDGSATAQVDSPSDDQGAPADDAARPADAATADESEQMLQAEKQQREEVQAELKEELETIEADKQKGAKKSKMAEKPKKSTKQLAEKVLSYDRSDIDAIGTQEQTGHTICCPSFSCAYGDAVIDGTVNDHSYYTCSCCTWNDWGGGGSYCRSVGSSEELLREAYDQISAGKPTVIHVTGYGSGEHWICLIGFKDAKNPDSLTLDNFVALDPWDGAEITASERYSLFGDGCEHISSR